MKTTTDNLASAVQGRIGNAEQEGYTLRTAAQLLTSEEKQTAVSKEGSELRLGRTAEDTSTKETGNFIASARDTTSLAALGDTNTLPASFIEAAEATTDRLQQLLTTSTSDNQQGDLVRQGRTIDETSFTVANEGDAALLDNAHDTGRREECFLRDRSWVGQPIYLRRSTFTSVKQTTYSGGGCLLLPQTYGHFATYEEVNLLSVVLVI